MQVFSPTSVLVLKLSAAAALVIVSGTLLVYRTLIAPTPAIGAPVEQQVPFSHKHHVGDDGLDCRFCHASVETAAFAGIPSLATCMTCHSQLFSDAPVLAPIRDAYASGKPLVWRRVHDLPDFVYFDHSIHVTKGIGCSSCHGAVDTMPLTWRTASLRMQWCLECHREPERALRPRSEIFNLHWQPPPDQVARGRQLRMAYNIHSRELLTSCSTCHR